MPFVVPKSPTGLNLTSAEQLWTARAIPLSPETELPWNILFSDFPIFFTLDKQTDKQTKPKPNNSTTKKLPQNPNKQTTNKQNPKQTNKQNPESCDVLNEDQRKSYK